eukprot:scaffold1033_cov171-Amphora_coffeaeformis.AAC.23
MRFDHPNSVSGMIGHTVCEGYAAFGNLDKLLGPDAVDRLWDLVFPDYPYEQGGIWKLFHDEPEREEGFGRAMWSLEGLGGKAMAMDAPFNKFDRFIDIGGSLGHFLYKIMLNNPGIEGILLDRPEVIENAKKLWYEDDGMYKDGTQESLTMINGDFFDSSAIPEGRDGDVYFMRYILHDWQEAECLKILRNLHEKMKGKKTTLLIGECAMPNRDTIGQPPAIYKVDMLMLDIFGDAMERTPLQWKDLLEKAGFQLVAIYPTRSLVHFVEAVPMVD